MQNVRLTQPNAAIEEQRIIRPRRLLRHSQAGSMSQTVIWTHDEIIKAVFRSEMRLEAVCLNRLGDFLGDSLLLFLLGRGGSPYFEANFNRSSHHATKLVDQCRLQAAFQPVTGISIGSAQGKGSSLFIIRNQLCVLHPGIISRTGKFHLQLSEGSLPCLLSVHYAFSLIPRAYKGESCPKKINT